MDKKENRTYVVVDIRKMHNYFSNRVSLGRELARYTKVCTVDIARRFDLLPVVQLVDIDFLSQRISVALIL